MIVIPPIAITDSNLVSSTVAEPSSGETAWNATTSVPEKYPLRVS